MNDVLVSICIPAYNAQRFIAATLESALRQDYPNLEIIVSDDGSADRTAEIVQAYGSRGVRLIRQARNLGMTGNMNAVIR
ncbi:MAG: glycosyltransferase family 2 protein, partial [Deltaproteobacteria bacterium]|nr:glycosyltransferase family 2 protein [Deltaproteobacteria bacterium]